MKEFNTKIELNDEVVFLHEPQDKNISEELFDSMISRAHEFIMNTDGEDAGTSEELKEFDISPDKEYGNDWHFEINEKSKELIIKTFKGYKSYWHFKWTLNGEGFSIHYEDVGDEMDLMDGPSGEKTVGNYFKINAKGEALERIKDVLGKYEKAEAK